jgi:hypothetical protein
MNQHQQFIILSLCGIVIGIVILVGVLLYKGAV